MSGKPVLQALSLVAVATLAACSGGSPAATGTASPTSSAASAAPTVTIAPTVAPAPTVEATPTAFTSAVYGYSLTVPAGWAIGPALTRWDGTSEVGDDDPFVDKFASPGTLSFFAFAKPYTGTLDAFAKDEIAATVRDHSDTCLHPDPPAANEPITIAGQPGVFLAWDCGILINQVVTVRNGTAFAIVSRDTAIQAATMGADGTFRVPLDMMPCPRDAAVYLDVTTRATADTPSRTVELTVPLPPGTPYRPTTEVFIDARLPQP